MPRSRSAPSRPAAMISACMCVYTRPAAHGGLIRSMGCAAARSDIVMHVDVVVAAVHARASGGVHGCSQAGRQAMDVTLVAVGLLPRHSQERVGAAKAERACAQWRATLHRGTGCSQLSRSAAHSAKRATTVGLKYASTLALQVPLARQCSPHSRYASGWRSARRWYPTLFLRHGSCQAGNVDRYTCMCLGGTWLNVELAAQSRFFHIQSRQPRRFRHGRHLRARD